MTVCTWPKFLESASLSQPSQPLPEQSYPLKNSSLTMFPLPECQVLYLLYLSQNV